MGKEDFKQRKILYLRKIAIPIRGVDTPRREAFAFIISVCVFELDEFQWFAENDWVLHVQANRHYYSQSKYVCNMHAWRCFLEQTRTQNRYLDKHIFPTGNYSILSFFKLRRPLSFWPTQIDALCEAKRYMLLKFMLNTIKHRSVGIFFDVACLEKTSSFATVAILSKH